MTTDTTPTPADFTAAAADMTRAVRRLAELSRAEGNLGNTVAALDALNADGGPLAELGALFRTVAEWLPDFEDDDLERAADRADDCAQSTDQLQYAVGIVANIARPLAG